VTEIVAVRLEVVVDLRQSRVGEALVRHAVAMF
jgi:hypothetical protein